MWQKYKTEIIIAAIIIIAVISIYLWGRKRGKESANGPDVNYPDGGAGIPAGWNPTPLAKELHQVMDGLFTLASTKDETFEKLLALPTDDMFTSVYSAFNQLYFSEGEGTLREWINAESNTVAWDDTVESINNRFDQLNLE